MTTLERIAQAALNGDSLQARSLMQDWLQTAPVLADVPVPSSTHPTVISLTAALSELIADRLGQLPPSWATTVPGVTEPVYLVRAAHRMRRLRETCEAESPPPLRRRRFFAPANYLEAV